MATAVIADTYLQQIHTTRTQLHECFMRAHELLADREAYLLGELETIQNNYETETNSQQEELQGLAASKQALKNHLRNNDTLNKALATINEQIEEILKLSSVTARTIRFQWNTALDRDLQHAGQFITTTPLTIQPDPKTQPANLMPVIPQLPNLQPVILQPGNMIPVFPQPPVLTPVIPQPAVLTPVILQPAVLTLPQPTNLAPIIPQLTNLAPVIPQPTIPDYSNDSISVITSCRHKPGTSPGELYIPNGIAVEPQSGRFYIADTGNDKVQVFTSHLEFCFMFTRNMNGPHGICINTDTVYVSQWRCHSIALYKLDGTYVNKFGSHGARNGQFKLPTSLAVSPTTGHLYVCDCNNNRMQVFDEKLKFRAKFANNLVINPRDVKLIQHLIIVLDRGDPCIHLFNITNQTLLMSIISRGVNKQTIGPIFFTVDREVNILLTDFDKHCVCVFSQSGELVTHFGKLGHSAGEFYRPAGIAIDNQNRIVVVSKNTNNALQLFIL